MAQIINEERDRLIAWRSLEGASVDNSGLVRFIEAPEGRGTEVRVTLDYIPPAVRVGQIVAKFFGEEPEIQIREDLRRFKRLMEAGRFRRPKDDRKECADVVAASVTALRIRIDHESRLRMIQKGGRSFSRPSHKWHGVPQCSSPVLPFSCFLKPPSTAAGC